MMYKVFSDLCNNQKGKLNLCGLSLGGLLALDFVKEYPEKVNSIILIGTPYKIPKTLFKIQSLLFQIMPKKLFKKIGCSKILAFRYKINRKIVFLIITYRNEIIYEIKKKETFLILVNVSLNDSNILKKYYKV